MPSWGASYVHFITMATSLLSDETPIFKLTVGEFKELLSQHGFIAPSSISCLPSADHKYVYGIAGLAQLLNCSHPTAHRLKASGKIPFTQAGRKIVFEEKAVLSALEKGGRA